MPFLVPDFVETDPQDPQTLSSDKDLVNHFVNLQ